MLNVKDAVTQAFAFTESLLDGSRVANLLLEEVEKRGDKWLITLSMPSSHPLGALSPNRDYKTFTIDAVTGEVLSMKIRELAGAS